MTRRIRSHRTCLFVRPLEDRVTPTAGAIDRSFGANGFRPVVDLNMIVDIASQPDGGVVVLGTVADGTGGTSDPTQDFGVVRLTKAGAVDTTFGTSGLVRIGFNIQADGKGPDVPSQVAVRPDGEIVVVGQALSNTTGSTDAQAAVALLTAAGKLDTAFNGNGKLTFHYLGVTANTPSPGDRAGEVAVLADNSIVVAGSAFRTDASFVGHSYAGAARLTPTGAFDPAFGGSGKVAVEVRTGGFSSFTSDVLASGISPTGAVFFAYKTDDAQFASVYGLRLNPDGSPDATYGTAGKATLGDAGSNQAFSETFQLRPQADGTLVYVNGDRGLTTQRTVVSRFLANGTLDSSFGTTGTFTSSGKTGGAVYVVGKDALVDPSGRVFVVGDGPFANTYAFRLTNAGKLDTGFDADGYVETFATGGSNSYVQIAALTADDFLLLAGSDFAASSSSQGVLRAYFDNSQNTPPTITPLPDQTVALPFAQFAQGTFTYGDRETPESLTVTATSSNPAVVANTTAGVHVNLTKAADGRLQGTIGLTPTQTAGSTTITITVTDRIGATATSTFVATVVPAGDNTSPTLSPLPDRVIDPATATPIIVIPTDAQTASDQLTVTATSSNPAVIPADGLSLAADGNYRTLTLTPATGATSGSSVIRVTATDAAGLVTFKEFTVTLGTPPANQPPTIAPIADQTTVAGGFKSVSVTLSDPDGGSFPTFFVAASSSDQTVLPNKAVIASSGFSGTGSVQFTPAAGPGGTAVVTVVAVDAGGAFVTRAFNVTVTPSANTPPTISTLSNASVAAGAVPAGIPFTVGDVETPAANLTVTVTESNSPALYGATITGTGANRTLTFARNTAAAGSVTTFTVTVTDAGGLTASRTFTLTVTGGTGNTAPTISGVANQTLTAGQAPTTLNFTVSDIETPAASLQVSVTSANPLVATATVGGTGANRTVTVTPLSGAGGSSLITVTVTDGGGLTASRTFTATVNPANTAPTIDSLADRTLTAGQAPTAVTFGVGDAETAARDLQVSVASSNPQVVTATVSGPVGGFGVDRTVTLTPLANGSSLITLTVTDADGLTATRTFTVTVNPVQPPANTAPTVGAVTNPTLTAGQAAAVIPIGVSDAETPAGNLGLTAATSDPLVATVVGGGTGANRTVSVTPLAAGTATVTLTVTDAGGLTATRAFAVTVTPADGGTARPPLLVGVSATAVGGSDGTVRVVTDGKPGDPIPALPGFAGPVRTATADFNGDGVPDIAAGTGPGAATRVRVLDGKTGAELFATDPFEASFTGGVFVAAGDVTGDGVPDLLISPDEGGGPRVRVFSGKGYGQVADFFGIDDPDFRGGARTAVGDVTGDGVGDLVIAAGFGGGPRVAVFDGTSLADGKFTRKPFADFFAFEEGLRNGVYAAAGDLNGDGYAELIAGAGPGGGPRVSGFDGKTLVQQNTADRTVDFLAGDVDSRDGVRVAVKNLDGDALADIVTGAGSGGRVSAYAGKSLPSDKPTPLFDSDLAAGAANGVYVG